MAARDFEAAELAIRGMNAQLATARNLGRTFRVGGGGHGGGHGMAAAGIGGMMGSVLGMPGKIAGAAIGLGVDAMIGMDVAKGFMGPGMEYQNSLTKLRMLPGLSQQDINMAQTSARKTAAMVPTTTSTQNLDTFRELYSILGTGKQKEAADLLPVAAKMRTALAGFTEHMPNLKGKEDALFATVAKTAEMTGHLSSEKDFTEFTSKMMRSVISSGGMASPVGMAQTIKLMHSAKFGKDDDFMFGVLPYLIQEMAVGAKGGGGSRGVAPLLTAFDRALNRGIMTKGLAGGLQDMGLMTKAPGVTMNSSNIQTLVKAGAISGGDLVQRDPFEWTQKFFVPAMLKKQFPNMTESAAREKFDSMDQGSRSQIINKSLMGTTQGFSDLISQFVINEKNIRKHIELFRQVPPLDEEYNKSLQSTAMQLQKVNAQFTELLTTIGNLKPVTDTISGALTATGDAFKNANQFITTFNTEFPKTTQMLQEWWDKFRTGFGLLGDAKDPMSLGDALGGLPQTFSDNLKQTERMGIVDQFRPDNVFHNPVTAIQESWKKLGGWKGINEWSKHAGKQSGDIVPPPPNTDPGRGGTPLLIPGGAGMPKGGHFAVPPPPIPATDFVAQQLASRAAASKTVPAGPTPPPKVEVHFHGNVGKVDQSTANDIKNLVGQAVDKAHKKAKQEAMMGSLAHSATVPSGTQSGVINPNIPVNR